MLPSTAAVLAAAAVLSIPSAATAGQAGAAAAPTTASDSAVVTASSRFLRPPLTTATRTPVDGFVVTALPGRLGATHDADFEFDDVMLTARYWESRARDGFRVDAQVTVLRGPKLSSRTALRTWMVDYQERTPFEARARLVRVGDRQVWLGRDQAYWLERPGVAVAIRLDPNRWGERSLRRAVDSTWEIPFSRR